MYRVGNKIVKFGSKIPMSENRTMIEVTVRGTSFPDRAGATFSLTPSPAYIDFDDGTGLHYFADTSWSAPITNFYYYQDLADQSKIGTVDANYPQQRVVKIYPLFPQKVNTFYVTNQALYGDFPKNIGNYNLTNILWLSTTVGLNNFPERLRGGVFYEVNFNNISPARLTQVPSWIGNSRIKRLSLQNVFNLSAGFSVTNVDVICSAQGLEFLALNNNMMANNNSWPPNLKNIATLKELRTGGDNFVTFPSRIGECSQIETLIVTSTLMTNWGDGWGLMTSLKSITFNTVGGSNNTLSPDLPLGLSNCVALQRVEFSITYKTQSSIDTFVNNIYDFVVANASSISGNTKFRNMNFILSGIIGTTLMTPRPSGGTTPTSVVEPPPTALQKVYNLCKKYGHTWSIRNLANNGVEIIAP